MSTPSPSASILIVENDGELLEVLQLVLEDAGYEVSGAADVAEALRLLGIAKVDLLVLDVELDRMGVLDVAREMRAGKFGPQALIALHTGLAEADVRGSFDAYDLFLPRSDDAEQLVQQISGLLTARRATESRSDNVAAEATK